MIRLRLRKAALHDQAIATAGGVVAGRAVDVVALLPAIEDRLRHLEGQLAHEHRAVFPREEGRIGLKCPACNRALDERPRARRVREEGARPERPVLRLIVHVLTAAGDGGEDEDRNSNELARGRASAFISARGAPPPLALARRLRAALGPQALLWTSNARAPQPRVPGTV